MFSRSLLRAAVVACAAVIPALASAQTLTFDVAQSFFTLNTAASPFQAGYETEPLGTLTQYSNRGVMAYNGAAGPETLNTYNAGSLVPGLFLAGATGYNDPSFTPKFGSNVLGFHPGPDGQLSAIRFTAPIDGLYTFSFTNYGLDASGPDGGTSTNVYLYCPETADSYCADLPQGGSVLGFGADSYQHFDVGVGLTRGQFIDLAVDDGGNGYFYDMTALDAQVTVDAGPDTPAVTTPEPTTVALVGAGVLALGAAARRRRQA